VDAAVSPVTQVCPICREPVTPGELFCEGCGADLSAPPPSSTSVDGVASSDGVASPSVASSAVAGADAAAVDPVADAAAVGPVADAAAVGPVADAAAVGPVADAAAVDPVADAAAVDPVADAAAVDPVADAAAVDPVAGQGWRVHDDEPDLTVRARYCAECGGPVAEDGYCARCGSPAPPPRDHWLERPVPWVAAVCDRGVRHAHNEDAVAVAATERPGSFAVLVVSDGVSSSRGSDVASLAGVRAARDALIAAAAGAEATPAASRPGLLAGFLADAGLRANTAVVATAGQPPGPNPPSCTFVAAAVADGVLVAGWVGDSRVYWLPDAGQAEQVSADDSWAGEAVAAGIPQADAERAPQAHAITRWLGVDAPDPMPRTAARLLDEDGWVLVCSDGLWNYCSPAADLQDLVRLTVSGAGPEPAQLASALVTWAKQQGGHDNITVALARIQRPPEAG
jgi:serine/threonine protein phosphatase PrpC